MAAWHNGNFLSAGIKQDALKVADEWPASAQYGIPSFT
jgi:hypothetical protein